jgi:hypothetical protein
MAQDYFSILSGAAEKCIAQYNLYIIIYAYYNINQDADAEIDSRRLIFGH